MKIKSIKFNTRKADVYDIETPTHDYILKNGIISHNTQEMYSKPVVSGGTGVYLSADNIFILGRQQEKEGTEVIGYNFIINVEKSRYVREKSKIPINVLFEGGVSKWSGLLEMALESGHVIKPNNGWYSRVDKITGELEEKRYRLKDTLNKEFWLPILAKKDFQQWIKDSYKLTESEMLSDSKIENELLKVDSDFEIEELEDEELV